MVRSTCLAMLLVLSTAVVSVAAGADAKPEDAVREASARFYAALNQMLNGDATALEAVWSHGDNVTTMHPIGGRQIGWDQVKESWQNVASVASDGAAQLEDQWIRVIGNVAYEIGTETGHFKLGGHEVSGFHNRVTNIYVREDGTWKVVHHHVDLSPEMVEILSQLPPPGAAK